jgi:hypothetical protein
MASVPIADATAYNMKFELHGDITEFPKGGTCSMNVNKQKITNNLIWKTYIEDIN